MSRLALATKRQIRGTTNSSLHSQSIHDPEKKSNQPHEGHNPQLKNCWPPGHPELFSIYHIRQKTAPFFCNSFYQNPTILKISDTCILQ